MFGVDWLYYAYLALMAVSVVYALTNQPKTPVPAALTLDDVKIPSIEIGKSIPVVFGTRDIADPLVVWYGDLRTSPVKADGGGK